MGRVRLPARARRDLPPPTADDLSRTLDGTVLDSAAAVVRHMAEREASGKITHTGTMFRDLLDVLEREGEDAMITEMWRRHEEDELQER